MSSLDLPHFNKNNDNSVRWYLSPEDEWYLYIKGRPVGPFDISQKGLLDLALLGGGQRLHYSVTEDNWAEIRPLQTH